MGHLKAVNLASSSDLELDNSIDYKIQDARVLKRVGNRVQGQYQVVVPISSVSNLFLTNEGSPRQVTIVNGLISSII